MKHSKIILFTFFALVAYTTAEPEASAAPKPEALAEPEAFAYGNSDALSDPGAEALAEAYPFRKRNDGSESTIGSSSKNKNTGRVILRQRPKRNKKPKQISRSCCCSKSCKKRCTNCKSKKARRKKSKCKKCPGIYPIPYPGGNYPGNNGSNNTPTASSSSTTSTASTTVANTTTASTASTPSS